MSNVESDVSAGFDECLAIFQKAKSDYQSYHDAVLKVERFIEVPVESNNSIFSQLEILSCKMKEASNALLHALNKEDEIINKGHETIMDIVEIKEGTKQPKQDCCVCLPMHWNNKLC